jgi:hypothetical protein
MVRNLVLIGLAVTLDLLPLTAFFVVLPSKRGARTLRVFGALDAHGPPFGTPAADGSSAVRAFHVGVLSHAGRCPRSWSFFGCGVPRAGGD